MKLRKPSLNHHRAEQRILAQQSEEQENPRLNVDQAARFLGVSVSTLNRWRGTNEGPEWIRLGGRVYYYARELNVFAKGQ